jgi:hypothetical protein
MYNISLIKIVTMNSPLNKYIPIKKFYSTILKREKRQLELSSLKHFLSFSFSFKQGFELRALHLVNRHFTMP